MGKLATMILEKLRKVHSMKEARGVVEELARDHRRKVTPEIRAKVLRLAGRPVTEIRETMLRQHQVSLSDPTIRKIIKESV